MSIDQTHRAVMEDMSNNEERSDYAVTMLEGGGSKDIVTISASTVQRPRPKPQMD